MTFITPERLREKLAQPGRSQAELARLLGVDASAVHRMTTGARHIRVKDLPIIMDYLQEADDQVPTIHAAAHRVMCAENIDGDLAVPGLTFQQAVYLAAAALNTDMAEHPSTFERAVDDPSELIDRRAPPGADDLVEVARRRQAAAWAAMQALAEMVRVVDGKVFIRCDAGEVICRAIEEARA